MRFMPVNPSKTCPVRIMIMATQISTVVSGHTPKNTTSGQIVHRITNNTLESRIDELFIGLPECLDAGGTSILSRVSQRVLSCSRICGWSLRGTTGSCPSRSRKSTQRENPSIERFLFVVIDTTPLSFSRSLSICHRL